MEPSHGLPENLHTYVVLSLWILGCGQVSVAKLGYMCVSTEPGPLAARWLSPVWSPWPTAFYPYWGIKSFRHPPHGYLSSDSCPWLFTWYMGPAFCSHLGSHVGALDQGQLGRNIGEGPVLVSQRPWLSKTRLAEAGLAWFCFFKNYTRK